jgi:hypothetical protein
MKTLYTIFFSLIAANCFAGEEIKACSSVLPFICQTPDCSDNKKIATLCDGKMSFTEQGTECMSPRIPMGKCTRAKEAPWYIALKGGKHVVLKSAAEISALFAPVTDPKTAQGVALLLTEDFPLFAAPYPTLNNGWCSDQSDPGKWINRIAAVTTVEKVDKGFQVKLFTIAHIKNTDQLLPHTYIIGTDGSIVDHVTGTSPLWMCGKLKK